MESTRLTELDYTRMLSFISQTKKHNNDFQQHVLNLLNEIFGYKYTTFNLINNKLDLYDTKLFNISKNSKEQYYEYYHKTDIFNPKVRLNLMLNKNVVSITDIMPASKYENTEYYIDFLKKDTLYYELALPLKANNMLIGGIGIFRPKDEGGFSYRDIAILDNLNDFISSSLWTFSELTSIRKDYQIYNSCVNETSAGIVILDRDCSIMRYNKASEEIARELPYGSSPYNSIQQFIHEIFGKFADEIKISSPNIRLDYKSYNINIILNLVSSISSGIEPVYIIFITRKREESRKASGGIPANCNLTDRELEIMELVRNGLSNEEIAENLYISVHTVKSHMENIFKKLKVKNRTAALNKINTPVLPFKPHSPGI